MSKTEYITKYENLYIHVIDGHWGIWVNRDGKDGEAICYHQPTEAELETMNAEAGKALQDGWFYCSRCHTAKPDTEFAYFYFAGKYCNDCKESNLPHYNEAMRESYN